MGQMDIFGEMNEAVKRIILPGRNEIPNGLVHLHPNFFNSEESKIFFDSLRNNILWKQESMQMYGKKMPFPRLTAWYGDNDKSYTFSGITLHPNGWNTELKAIKEKIEPVAGLAFNSVLLNLYRNGNDSISWHSDSEKELGFNPTIASVNFGETRTFQIRHIKTNEKIDIVLKSGTLLIMEGEMQHYWQHQVPKTNKIVKERINLTFRVLK
ncbi:alpha-ketoglutarate-dependent dioxygenase AlkB [Fluviicola sp.]|uniref:alpha-ketoglutarate-dependent dioxygenase AlkB family protein n=1 Tax=Fluviicola sp. TaxID=1917219 RepID=UPI0031E41BCD